MPSVTEGALTFHFPEHWLIVNYDADKSYYKSTLERSPMSYKAVDIIASDIKNHQHIWFEIKDCIGCEAENRPRFSGNKPAEVLETKAFVNKKGFKKQVNVTRKKPFIADEIAQKVNDTFTGIISSIRAQETSLQASHAIILQQQSLDIVLFLTLNDELRDYKRLALRLEHAIRSRVNILHINRVMVCKEDTIPAVSAWSVTREGATS